MRFPITDAKENDFPATLLFGISVRVIQKPLPEKSNVVLGSCSYMAETNPLQQTEGKFIRQIKPKAQQERDCTPNFEK